MHDTRVKAIRLARVLHLISGRRPAAQPDSRHDPRWVCVSR